MVTQHFPGFFDRKLKQPSFGHKGNELEICLMKKREINHDRRTFIRTAALTGCAAMVTGIPLATYVIAPAAKKGTGKWVAFGATDEVSRNNFVMLSYEFMVKDGWLVLPQRGFVWAKSESGNKFTVFSSTCTHLACNVIWQEETATFDCPCHSGKFDTKGQPISGPPTRALTELEYKIEDGNLLVHLTV
jgi:Rieske Fe-S protein